MGSAINNANITGTDPERDPVLRSIRDEVQQEKDRRLADWKRSKEFVAEAKLGPERAREALLNKRADIAAATEANLQFGLKRAEALAASRKVDPNVLAANLAKARAESDQRLADTRQEIAGRNLARAAVTNTKVTSTLLPGAGAKPGAQVRWQ